LNTENKSADLLTGEGCQDREVSLDDPLPSGPGQHELADLPLLDEMLGRFSDALALAETAHRALYKAQEDETPIGPEVVTLRRSVEELNRVYTEFDLTLVRLQKNGLLTREEPDQRPQPATDQPAGQVDSAMYPPKSDVTQTPDLVAQMLKDGIVTAVKRLRRIDDDLESIESFVYVSITALRAPGDDATEDIAKVLDSAYVQLVEHVGDDVRAALEALGETGRAS
jgi:hypothetical protein